MNPILSVQQLTRFQDGKPIVKEVSFTLQAGQNLAIAGETGSGKSSLLKMITGHIQPDAGQVLFKNKRVEGPLEKLLPGHPDIAYLSQYFELRNNYTVYEELSYTNQLTDEEAATVFRICQITHLLQRRTNQLSGGEKQRIALARQLIKKPAILVLDEPFSNLDPVHKNSIKNVLDNISRQLGITTILVSHDAMDTLSWAHELLLMKDGIILQQGKPETVYNKPVNEYCAGLLGHYNLISNTNKELAAQLPTVQWRTSRFIIRPEQITLQPAANDITINGKITDILFYGAFYLLQVQVAGQKIQCLATLNTLPPKNTEVSIGFNSRSLVFV